MKQRKKVALYPIFADTLPVARYLIKYRPDVEVVELLSIPGSCVCGQDAAVLDNREEMGIVVKSYTDTNPNSWDVLYLLQHDTLGLTEEDMFKSIYSPMIDMVRNYHHKISILKSQRFAEDSLNDEMEFKNGNVIKKYGVMKPIKTFTVFIGGIIAEANAFEVFLNLFGELAKIVRVSAFSSSKNAETCGAVGLYDLLYNNSMSEEQKVFALERRIRQKSKEQKADIIIVQLDEALIPYSDTLTNGFGIIPYIVSQIIEPDYCVCCLPFGYTNTSILNEFERGVEGRFGFLPDQWHISNSMLDFTTLTTIRDAGAIHVPMAEVEHVVNDACNHGLNICSAVIPEYLGDMASSVLSSFKESQSIYSII